MQSYFIIKQFIYIYSENRDTLALVPGADATLQTHHENIPIKF